MVDASFSAALAMSNAIVAALNLNAWTITGDVRDVAATIAWAGSTAYWLVRLWIATRGEHGDD